ncbi:MAG: DNA polymerase III subunit delta [Draconibacterium sp.]|nr:MAG: DNA polymerase III subunit delta [Draconibacterium sp.]
MFFKDIIGQEKIKKRLIKSVTEERISHAQLFSGHKGTGKLAMAIAYAQFISCKNRSATDSCGTCPSCHKYNKLTHPDLHFVFPIFNTKKIKKPVCDDFLSEWREMVLKNPYFTLGEWLKNINAGNAPGMIYERESDSIYRKLNLKSFESEFKVMIIWLPEKMHIACANKLLKLIEEPPNKTLFLLITEDAESVISTIRSRVQPVNFPFVNDSAIRLALENNSTLSPEQIADAVQLAGGSYIKALENLNPSEEEQFFFNKFQELMRMAYLREIIPLTEWAEEMAGTSREQQKAFLAFALRLIREYFIFNFKNYDLISLKAYEKDWGKKFAPFINERNIIPFFNEFELGFKQISMNGNPRIIFLDIALKIVRLIKR